MDNKIVCLIDGSGYAQSVCDHAAWVATRGQYTLILLHVLGRRNGVDNNADLSGSIGLGARTALLEELAEVDGQKARLANKRGRAILDDARERVASLGASYVTTKLCNGQLIETMHDYEADADMLVIGKRGEASNFDMEHLGSNLERVARSSSKPILVASRSFQPINKMLIAFDGGASAIKAVAHIVGSEVYKGLDVVLVQAGTETSNAKQQLEGAAVSLRESGYSVESKFVTGQPDQAIAKIVDEENIDLLVMGAYGHSRIRNLIIGSTTTQMLAACKIPVLLFR